jgi:CYTH domain-containing protein
MSKLPKYAHWVTERRFLVDPEALPPLDESKARQFEDLYLDGGRLRLRAITFPTQAQEFKIAKKYAQDDPLVGPMANLYLTEEEHRVLAVLPGATLVKKRHRLGAFVIDVFEGDLAGLVLAECEAANRMAAMAVKIPAWCIREVTADPAYTGWRLAHARPPTT